MTGTPLLFPDNVYTTPSTAAGPLSALFPNISFYWRMCATLHKAATLAKQGRYDAAAWIQSSLDILAAMEKCGTRVTIEGFDNFRNLNGPCVFVGNHMSTLETFALPAMIQTFKPVTFVVKDGLLRYPVFHHVMKARDPIVVQRKDARADFTAVMKGGEERLKKGVSVIIFPQSTRRPTLERKHFNSLGIKLARKAGVPVTPIAIRTDAWGMGGLFGLLKDHGPITPSLPVHFRFGPAITVEGNGKAEHEAVFTFIEDSLAEWGIAPTSAPSP